MVRALSALLMLALSVLPEAAGGASAQAGEGPPSPPPALVYYGGMPGRLTMERDHQGGNPFASGLIDVLREAHVTLADFGQRLAAETSKHAGGWQLPDVPRRVPPSDWTVGASPGEKRIALIAAVADYSRADGILSLAGSRFDTVRLEKALTAAGFETRVALDLDRAGLTAELEAFGIRSREADVALVYAGGHGVQRARTAYLVMGDYPVPRDASYLSSHAVSVPELAGAAQARKLNLVLFAGCRNDPFLK